MALFHQIVPKDEPPAKPQSSKPSRKPTTKPVEKIAAQSTTSERIEPPETVSPPQSHAVRTVSANDTHCPTCGHRLPAFDKKAYQRDYMRVRRARQKARE
jgi:hypothetical protein